MSTNGINRHPPKWVAQLYSFLAGGRYSAYWLTEFMVRYHEILETSGEEAAVEWAMSELALSVGPALSIRAYRLIRLVYLSWRLYERLAGN
jgi:hypothetical protein